MTHSRAESDLLYELSILRYDCIPLTISVCVVALAYQIVLALAKLEMPSRILEMTG